jgi:outer membrane protein OmpA-like peptidoglycan-associated protein
MIMSNKWMAVGALSATMLVSGACSTKRYVREQVNARSNELTVKMEEKDASLESSIQSTASQVNELSGVSREHGQRITTLDTGLKATDEKAANAMTTGSAAQNTANQAMSQISALDDRFARRNKMEQKEESTVLFTLGSAKIDPDNDTQLNEIASKLKQNPDLVLVLEGRTDATGDALYNIQLGQKRMEAIERFLVVNQGVPVHQIFKMSYGEDNPMAENSTREGRKQNRAVVLRLMAPTVDGQGQTLSSSNMQ